MPRQKRRRHHHIRYGGRNRQNRRATTPGVELTIIAATPATLAAVLSAANAGEIIELAAGTYTGTWQVNTKNLTIRNKAGTRPVIDGGLVLWQDGITVQGLEILNSSWPNRTSVDTIPFGVEIVSPAAGCRVINCIIHDTDTAIIGAEGLTAIGNLIYNIGVSAWEHAIYVNNDTHAVTVRDNIFMPAYGYGLHAYSSAGGKANNVTFDHNVMIACPNIQFAQGIVSYGAVARDNEGFSVSLIIGQVSQDNLDATIADNYLVYSQNGTVLDVRRWNDPTMTGNTLIGDANDQLLKYVPVTGSLLKCDNNTYVLLNANATKFVNDNGTDKNFVTWKADHSGADASSILTTSLPTTNRVIARSIDTDRAWIVVYDWENLAGVSLDLSLLGLTSGVQYVLRQAQDPLNDTATFTYDGSAVAVSMSGHTVATPTGASDPIVASTFWLFGCWLLEKA